MKQEKKNPIAEAAAYARLQLYLKRLQFGKRRYPVSFDRKDLDEVKRLVEHNKEFLVYLSRSPFRKRKQEKKNKKICFVLIPYEYGDWHQFTLNQALLLYVKGYDIEFLIDDISGMEEEYLFRGITGIALTLMLPILDAISGIAPVRYLSDCRRIRLTGKDKEEAVNLYKATETWLVGVSKTLSPRQYKRFLYTATFIKGAMADCDADVIQIYTGSHTKKGFYTLFAQQNGKRVATFDSQGKVGRTISYSSQGEQCHCPDIPYTILHDLLPEEVKEQIYEEVTQKYKDIAPGKFNDKYDIFVPLNIDWDAAALNVPGLFASTDEWIREVVEYVMQNTDATMILREHPARKYDPEFNYGNLKEQLRSFRGYDESRILFIDFDNPISTYDCLKHCSVVLPYSSTVGMEAIVMGKKTLNCMEVYFAKAGIGELPETKEALFERIRQCVERPERVSEEEKKLAALGIALHANITVKKTKFSELYTRWGTASFMRMYLDRDINKMLDSIAVGTPFCVLNIEDKVGNGRRIL